MTYKIKRRYIYVFQLSSPFFTLYKLLSVCVCLWIINVNHYGAMLYTQSKKNKKAKRLTQEPTKLSFIKQKSAISSKDLWSNRDLSLPGTHDNSHSFWWRHDFTVGPIREGFLWILALQQNLYLFYFLLFYFFSIQYLFCKSQTPFDTMSQSKKKFWFESQKHST